MFLARSTKRNDLFQDAKTSNEEKNQQLLEIVNEKENEDSAHLPPLLKNEI